MRNLHSSTSLANQSAADVMSSLAPMNIAATHTLTTNAQDKSNVKTPALEIENASQAAAVGLAAMQRRCGEKASRSSVVEALPPAVTKLTTSVSHDGNFLGGLPLHGKFPTTLVSNAG